MASKNQMGLNDLFPSKLPENVEITESPIDNEGAKTYSFVGIDLFQTCNVGKKIFVHPLIKPPQINKDTFWQIRANLSRIHPKIDDMNIAFEIQKASFKFAGLDTSYSNRNKNQFLNSMHLFLEKFNIFENVYLNDDLALREHIRTVISDPRMTEYSHINFFSTIYFIEYYLITEYQNSLLNKRSTIFDIGTGHGELPYLLSEHLPSTQQIVATELNLERVNSSLFEYLKSLNKQLPSNIEFIEHNLMNGIDRKLEKYQLMRRQKAGNESLSGLVNRKAGISDARIMVCNHVLEHLSIDTDKLLVKLLDVFDYIIISLPIEKKLNTSSGHKRLYTEHYFRNILSTQLKNSRDDIDIDMRFIDIGIYAVKKL